MKRLLYTTLFVALSPMVFAENCNEPALPESFQSMDALISSLDTNMANVETKGCDGDTELVRKSVSVAQRMIQNLSEDVRNVESRTPAEQKNFSDAAGRLRCMDRKIKDAKITCKALATGTYGWAIPMIGTGVQIDVDQHKSRAEKYFHWTNLREESLIAATILHEISHKCGTNDRHYYDLANKSLNDNSDWGNTADVFQNWAMYGFCRPGPECSERKTGTKDMPLASIR